MADTEEARASSPSKIFEKKIFKPKNHIIIYASIKLNMELYRCMPPYGRCTVCHLMAVAPLVATFVRAPPSLPIPMPENAYTNMPAPSIRNFWIPHCTVNCDAVV